MIEQILYDFDHDHSRTLNEEEGVDFLNSIFQQKEMGSEEWNELLSISGIESGKEVDGEDLKIILDNLGDLRMQTNSEENHSLAQLNPNDPYPFGYQPEPI